MEELIVPVPAAEEPNVEVLTVEELVMVVSIVVEEVHYVEEQVPVVEVVVAEVKKVSPADIDAMTCASIEPSVHTNVTFSI